MLPQDESLVRSQDMNSFIMTTRTVLEAVSAVFQSGETSFYLLLTCASILFSFLIIFQRRKDKTGESSHQWVPVSATSLDPLVASQSSTETLNSSFTQPQNAATMDGSAITHRTLGHTEFLLRRGNHEDNHDSGESHCSNIQESVSRWRNETAIDQHKLQPNSYERLDNVIKDSNHSKELSQHANTDNLLSDGIPPCAVTETSQADYLSQRSVKDIAQINDLPQHPVTESSQTDDLSQRPVLYSFQTDDLSQRPVTDSSQTDDLPPRPISYASQTDDLYQRSVTDVAQTDDLSQHPVTDSSQTDNLSHVSITDTFHTTEQYHRSVTDVAQTDNLCQRPVTDSSQTDNLSHLSITDTSHTIDLYQRDVTDLSQTGEVTLCAIADQTGELSQGVTKDVSQTDALLPNTLLSGDLFQSAIIDNPNSNELLQPTTVDTLLFDELFQPTTIDTPHSCELFQTVITDSHQFSLNKVSSSNHTSESTLLTSRNWCGGCQEINNVYSESAVVDHDREILHAFNDQYERNRDNSLYNNEQNCTVRHDSVDAVPTCDRDNRHHELLWQQLPLDSHLLPKSHARVRSSSTSNIAHTCHKPTRELRIIQDHMWRSKDPSCTATSCKIKAASEDSGVYSCVDSSTAADLYTSSDIHFTDQFPASVCTCMCKPPNSKNDPALRQEIPYQQEPVGTILPGDTYVTFVHSFPMTRSRYRELCYNSERRASYSRRKISRMVYRRLEEINPQNYATTAHTDLRNSYCQEPMCGQTPCVLQSNSLSGHSFPLCCERIDSKVSPSSAPATVLYRNPKQWHTNRKFRTTQMAGQFSNSPPSMNAPNVAPEICSYQQHPQVLLETAQNRHELGKVDTSTSIDPQVQLRRKRWGKSYCLPAERTRSMQMELMSRPLSLAMPVISQSNDSLSRRKQATLRDLEQHLSTHTKGIFRKRVSINNMLTWTKDSIHKPMIRSKDKSIRKEACEIFKMIQTYMGDRKGKQVQTLVALDVVTSGWAMPSLRDEIYVQLMRQTTDNKRDESLKSGWELLAMCLYFFPPSTKFHPFLESYISKHQEPGCNSDNIPSPELSADCLRRLKRAQKIVSKTSVHKPTIQELEHAKATICCPTMFGNMLEDIMLLQKDRYPDRKLPWIQTVLSEEILRLHGTQTEGIFRVSGDMDEVNSMKAQCDKWILPKDCTDPHIPASLLKLWYRELFEPLIPAQFYQACVDNFSNPEAAIALVYQLPRLNHLVLCYLIRFLQVFASPENVAFTKMDVNNLAMVMAPSCLRYESEDLLTIYEHVQKEMGFIRTLIRYLDTSFMEGIV